jgi:hypothetical protein
VFTRPAVAEFRTYYRPAWAVFDIDRLYVRVDPVVILGLFADQPASGSEQALDRGNALGPGVPRRGARGAAMLT